MEYLFTCVGVEFRNLNFSLLLELIHSLRFTHRIFFLMTPRVDTANSLFMEIFTLNSLEFSEWIDSYSSYTMSESED